MSSLKLSEKLKYETTLKRVAYIIPHYNNAAGLHRTLESIYRDINCVCEIIIYDDGSEDPLNIDAIDKKIPTFILHNSKNLGIGSALNALIRTAREKKYDYVALIDAGDLHLKGRIQIQVEMLESDDQLWIVGGDAEIVDVNLNQMGRFNPPITPKLLAKKFRRGYPFAHPTAMFALSRIPVDACQYNEKIKASVDYDMLYKTHLLNPKSIANCRECVIKYVREANSIGNKSNRRQAIEALKIRLILLNIRDIDSIIGLFDPDLWLRILSTRIYAKAKKTQSLINSRWLKRTGS